MDRFFKGLDVVACLAGVRPDSLPDEFIIVENYLVDELEAKFGVHLRVIESLFHLDHLVAIYTVFIFKPCFNFLELINIIGI